MKKIVQVITTIFIVVPVYFGAIYLFIMTIDFHDINTTLFHLSEYQINLLLLLAICQILLFEFLSQSIRKAEISNVFVYPTPNKNISIQINSILWYIFLSVLIFFGAIIPLLDLLGSLPFSITNNTEELVPKISLLFITGIYIFHIIERNRSSLDDLNKLTQKIGKINVLNRESDHQFMSEMLDDIQPKSRILVTHFEEPINPMKGVEDDNAYYYEDEFMKKWFRTIKEKELNVTQLVLINSDYDIDALKHRIKVTEDIPTYNIAYILAPPMTIYVDFMVVPDNFVLIAFSDNQSMRNMNIFSLLIRGGKAVNRFYDIFNNILLPEAKFVKTFEGIIKENLTLLENQSITISHSSLRIIKKLFDF